jgi:epoxyqueuosine reductase
MTTDKLTQAISREAIRLGFLECGFSKVRKVTECEEPYQQWLENGYQASMGYMERNIEKRLDPALLVEGAKTVVSLLYNYFTTDSLSGSPLKIAKYAFGDDYHDVVKAKLRELESYIQSLAGPAVMRSFVDSAPVLERFWAQNAGLGWIGRNSCLVSRRHGSFFFLAEIITSLELTPTREEPKDYCGTCRRCLEACPTQAITENRTVDSNRCISYHTIENRGEIPNDLASKFQNYIFGCDICQDVCPWTKNSHPHQEPAFALNKDLQNLSLNDWKNMEEENFRKLFRKSAVKRAKFVGIKRNINAIFYKD